MNWLFIRRFRFHKSSNFKQFLFVPLETQIKLRKEVKFIPILRPCEIQMERRFCRVQAEP